VAIRSAEKRRRARAERDWRIGTPNVRPVITLCPNLRLLDPWEDRGKKKFSRATVTFLPRRWFARPWVEAGRTSAQCAPRRPPFARVDVGHYLASVRPLEPRRYGVRSVAREGGEIPAHARVVRRSGLSQCDGDLCPADGVRGARGDGSVLGNPPRLQLAACLVSRPRFRSRRPRRRASTSRLSAQCKVARGARAT